MREPTIQAFLTRELGSDKRWTYVDGLPLYRIDTKASRDNQSRLGEEIDNDWVNELVLRLIDGIEFTALVAYEKPDGQLVLLGGNHRHEAYIRFIELGGTMTHTDFYIAHNPSSFEIEILSRCLNIASEIKPVELKDKEAQALYLHYTLKIPVSVAARKQGLKPDDIQKLRQRSDVRERLTRQGFTENLSGAKLSALYKVKTAKPLVEAAKTTVEMKLDDSQTRELTRKMVKSAGTEKSQLAEIEQFKKKYSLQMPTGSGPGEVTPSQKFWKAVTVYLGTRSASVFPVDDVQTRRLMKVISKAEEIIAESK